MIDALFYRFGKKMVPPDRIREGAAGHTSDSSAPAQGHDHPRPVGLQRTSELQPVVLEDTFPVGAAVEYESSSHARWVSASEDDLNAPSSTSTAVPCTSEFRIYKMSTTYTFQHSYNFGYSKRV